MRETRNQIMDGVSRPSMADELEAALTLPRFPRELGANAQG